MNNIRKLGFWSAVTSAIFSILWFITFQLQDVIAPVPDWHDLEAYSKAFSPLRILLVYPSLLLPITFIILLVCIHYFLPEDKRIWSLVALSLGILYATMASTNYNIQAVAVRKSLAIGQFGGIEIFIPDNTSSVFNALSNSYVYMALSMFFIGFAFENKGVQRWIRWIFLAQLLTALGQAGWTMFDLNTNIFIATSMIWVVGAPMGFILLGILFTRSKPNIAVQSE